MVNHLELLHLLDVVKVAQVRHLGGHVPRLIGLLTHTTNQWLHPTVGTHLAAHPLPNGRALGHRSLENTRFQFHVHARVRIS